MNGILVYVTKYGDENPGFLDLSDLEVFRPVCYKHHDLAIKVIVAIVN